jgi:hypothetical protein
LNNVLAEKLAGDPSFSPELREEVIGSSLALPDTLTAEQLAAVMNAYVFSERHYDADFRRRESTIFLSCSLPLEEHAF